MFSKSNQPIFIQLAEQIKEQVMEGKLKADDKVPSVRELAAQFEVNNNTSMHAIEQLARENIIYKSRGLGYYVTAEAKEIIIRQKQAQFEQDFLPLLMKNMRQLNLSIEQLTEMIKKKGDIKWKIWN